MVTTPVTVCPQSGCVSVRNVDENQTTESISPSPYLKLGRVGTTRGSVGTEDDPSVETVNKSGR